MKNEQTGSDWDAEPEQDILKSGQTRTEMKLSAGGAAAREGVGVRNERGRRVARALPAVTRQAPGSACDLHAPLPRRATLPL